MRIRRLIYIALLLLTQVGTLRAQLALDPSYTPQQLINDVFIGGGVTVSNITFSGSTQAVSKFYNGTNTTIGISSGVIMTTGLASNSVGPNLSGSKSTDNFLPGDVTLNTLASGTQDASVFEFDFVPLADTLRFRYVFGSDEYPEFVNSSYNDVFGFFISGPNPLGGLYASQNIALIPNTSTFVSINNVNGGLNSTYYINNNGGTTIEYDGLTTILTAWVKVVPCLTYHFKVAIADVGDGAYDSGVFLEEGSFSTGGISITPSYSNTQVQKVGIEGCNNLKLTVKLPKTFAINTIINIDTMWGTATNGVDFPLIKDTIVIQAGQKVRTLLIPFYADGVPEPTEDFNLRVNISNCLSASDTISFQILDYKNLTTTSLKDTLTCMDSLLLWTNPSNGIKPYYYSWSPTSGITNPNAASTYVSPTQTTEYIVTISDTSKCSIVIDTVKITVTDKPTVSFTADQFYGCEPLKIQLTDMTFPVGAKWLWDFGDGGTSTQQNPSHTYNAGKYSIKLDVTTADGCVGKVEVPNIINAYPRAKANFKAKPTVTTVENPTIQFTDMSQNATLWFWDFGEPASSSNTSNLQNPSHTYIKEGDYVVWHYADTDKGCKDSVSTIVKIVVDKIEVYNVITPNNDGHNDYFFIKNIERIESSRLKIYNRWGMKIYDAENYKNDWNAENAPDGTYFYILEYKTYFREGEAHGTITVIR